MKTALQLLCVVVLLGASARALAQASDEVPPPPVPPPLPAPSAGDSPPGQSEPNIGDTSPPEEHSPVGAEPGGEVSVPSLSAPAHPDAGGAGAITSATDPAVSDQKQTESADERNRLRLDSLKAGNTIYGPSGLLRLVTPDAGEPGTFRLSFLGSFFSGRGFLCPECTTRDGDVSERQDIAAAFSQRLALSVTPIEFLEATAALDYRQAKNRVGQPEVVQISGETMLGVRAFVPRAHANPVGFGGGALIEFLKRPNSVGVGATNVSLHLDGSLDLSRHAAEDSWAPGVPMRIAANVAYVFDNSAAMIDAIEADRSEEAGSRQRITRIERFGGDIDRVDNVRLGLGVEGLLGFVRPFAEWSIDVPANRQGYTCYHDALSADDGCLARTGFADIPSRLTLGVRSYPWFSSWMQGLSLLAAVDIATGGSSRFLEEVVPELPWNLHVGLGYAFDAHPRVKTERIEKLRTITVWGAPNQIVEGTVLDGATNQPVGQASVLFEGGDRPGMLTDAQGRFSTTALTPGNYDFRVTKEGYRESTCSVTVPPSVDVPPATTTEATSPPAPIATSVRCQLEALPARGDVEGALRDARTQEYVSGVNVRLTDPRGRSLAIETGERGGFRFENVPEGTSQLEFEAEGYVPSSVEVNVKRQGATSVQVLLQPKER